MTEHEFDRVCSLCKREYLYRKGAGHTKTVCNSCTVNNRRFIKKQRWVEYKGGKCERCGYSRSTRALSFHHTDPATKSFGLGGAHARSWASVKAELDKCLMLCANCHMEEHEALLTGGRAPETKVWNERVQSNERRLCECGNPTTGKQCKACFNTQRPTKISWPDNPTLTRLVWERSSAQLAKTLGVSDKAIEKHCKKLGIEKPPRGYWQKTQGNLK